MALEVARWASHVTTAKVPLARWPAWVVRILKFYDLMDLEFKLALFEKCN
jgi:hypothetical protein